MDMLLIYLLFSALAAAPNEIIRSNTITLKNAIGNYDIEIEQHSMPKNMLAQAINEVLKREKSPQLTLTYDSASMGIRDVISASATERNISIRVFEENKLNELLPPEVDRVSANEQNGLRTLLIIRCVGLGSGLFVGTGSSLAIAAYAGILNYIMMEVLYIPKRNGHMPGVDFVSSLMSKTTSIAKKQNPSMSSKRLSGIEGATNFLINYAMNFSMLVPFLGMTGADFQSYVEAFSSSELYIKSAYLATVVTMFLSSWKMAASRWEKLRSERQGSVITPKSQSRLINGIDFVMSFVNPGFWAGQFSSQVIVTTVGITGFLAYFYYDIKNSLGVKINTMDIFKKKTCGSLFD